MGAGVEVITGGCGTRLWGESTLGRLSSPQSVDLEEATDVQRGDRADARDAGERAEQKGGGDDRVRPGRDETNWWETKKAKRNTR